MIFKPAWALNASTSALLWRMISSIGRSNWKFTGLTLNLALASASGLMSCSFMRLLVLVCFSFHRRACLLGSQTTNRFSTIQGTFPLLGQCRDIQLLFDSALVYSTALKLWIFNQKILGPSIS